MTIGGFDIVVRIPPGVPATDLILRRIRHYWPDSRFQDADEDEDRSILDPRVQIRGSRVKEFFIYRDPLAAKSWREEGASPANVNSMLHFIINGAPAGEVRLGRVTIVCDEKTESISCLVADIEASFIGFHAPFNAAPFKAAA